jgi:hypothetical protein
VTPPFAPSESILHATAEFYNVDLINIEEAQADEIIFVYKTTIKEIAELIYSTSLETITRPVVKIIADDVREIKVGVHKLSRLLNNETLINAKLYLEDAQIKSTVALGSFNDPDDYNPDLLESRYTKLMACHEPLIRALDYLDAYPG